MAADHEQHERTAAEDNLLRDVGRRLERRLRAQQRQDREQRDHREALEQQDRERRAAVRAAELLLLGEQL